MYACTKQMYSYRLSIQGLQDNRKNICSLIIVRLKPYLSPKMRPINELLCYIVEGLDIQTISTTYKKKHKLIINCRKPKPIIDLNTHCTICLVFSSNARHALSTMKLLERIGHWGDEASEPSVDIYE